LYTKRGRVLKSKTTEKSRAVPPRTATVAVARIAALLFPFILRLLLSYLI